MNSSVLITIPLEDFKSLISETIRNEVSNLIPSEAQKQEDSLIKIGEVCSLLNVSKVTVHQWKKTGKLPFYRISNKIYFKKQEVIEALKKAERRRV